MGWGLCYDDFAGIFLPCVGVCYVEIGVLVRAGMIEGVGLYSRGSVVYVSTMCCVYCVATMLCADQVILKCESITVVYGRNQACNSSTNFGLL